MYQMLEGAILYTGTAILDEGLTILLFGGTILIVSFAKIFSHIYMIPEQWRCYFNNIFAKTVGRLL